MELSEYIVVDDEMAMSEEEASDSEAESQSEEEVTVKLPEPSENAVYSRDGLLDKHHDMSWAVSVDWIHRLTVEIDHGGEVDVDDDLSRELSFYTQALQGTRQAFEKLQGMGLSFLRPSDYYAEMVKSDAHMERVKVRLLHEKRQMEEAEERRKARENKRMAKEIQAQKMKERAKRKKDDIEAVRKWRKQRKQSGFADEDGGLELDLENGKGLERSGKKRASGVSPGDRSGGKGRRGKSCKKRELRDSKFGFGGRKRMKKQNNAADEFKGFSGGKTKANNKQKRR